MEAEIIQSNMEEEVIIGGSDLSRRRLGEVSDTAQRTPSKPSLETDSVRTGIKDAVKNLEREMDIFPEKEEIAEAEELNTTEESGAEDVPQDEMAGETTKSEKNGETRILGMKPLTFGLVAVGIIAAGFFAYKAFKKK